LIFVFLEISKKGSRTVRGPASVRDGA